MTKHSSSNSDSVSQVSQTETNIILDLLRKTLNQNIEGDIVEFGCYRGDTSVLLQREIRPPKTLWLYDSFEGLPEKSVEDVNSLGEDFKKGELCASKKQLISNLRKANVKKMPKITKGWFNQISREQIPSKISFAFLDGDYYDSILDPLNLIWNNLESGAVIVVDDYGNQALPGASKAVDEWCRKYNIPKDVEATLAIFKKP